VRILCCAVCGGLGILLFAGMAVTQEESHTSPGGATPVVVAAIDLSAVDSADECLDAQVCIDRYLWSLYERTRKVDTIKVPEQVKVAVKRKGKIRVVTKTVSKFVEEDFTWKDPDAAKRAGMSSRDFVIGGMDPSFRVTLYHALHLLEEAGLMPGITSAFRDNYRQTIASGQKAQTDRSFHGGSFRGGYGHGQAADVVSIKGETRAERLASSDQMWKWIDTHEKELGIGRPYLDRDAPHVAPVEGREYFSHRIEPKIQQAEKAKGHGRLALRGMSKRPRPTRAQSRPTHST
jgi:hypothetical protein